MSRTCIRERLESTLEKMRWQRAEVKAIYLTEADQKALNRLLSKEFGKPFKLHVLGYRDHPIRTGKQSEIYCKFGCAFIIPKRLSHRTEKKS